MKDIERAEKNLFNHATELFKGHEKLLGDKVRNRAFYDALKRRVTPDTSVLDIGSGTGVWAIVAARLGAKQVVAVEHDPLLIGLIRSLANANGVADRLEAVAGDSRQLGFGQRFDIVISETIGNLAFEEEIISIMIDARRRLLNPGGVLIPESIALVTSPVYLQPGDPKTPAGISLEYECFEWLARNIPVGIEDKSRLRLLSEPQELARVDLATIEMLPEFADMTACWELDTVSDVNGFAVWAEALLAEGVKLDTLETTSWTPLIYRVSPFTHKKGSLELKLTLTSSSNYWTASLSSEGETETQSFSPAYAASLLVAQSRTSVDLIGSPQRSSFAGMPRSSAS